MQSLLPSVGIF